MQCLRAVIAAAMASALLGERDKEQEGSGGAAIYSGHVKSTNSHTDVTGITQMAEILHFITPYHRGLEALVDVTPYSPLIRAMKKQENASTASPGTGPRFYAFIDTWVGDHHGKTETDVVRKADGTCSLQEQPIFDGSGNGFALSADLLFYPRAKKAVDTRPSHSVTLASGYFGSTYPIGDVSILEGTVAPGASSVMLETASDFKDTVDAACFRCEDGASTLRSAMQLGGLHTRAEMAARNGDERAVDKLVSDAFNDHLASALAPLSAIASVDKKSKLVHATYDPKAVRIEKGSPVFFDSGDVKSGESQRKRVGSVVSAGEDGGMLIQMEDGCLPMEVSKHENSSLTDWRPRLEVGVSGIEVRAKRVAEGLREMAAEASAKHQERSSNPSAMLLEREHTTEGGWKHIESVTRLMTTSSEGDLVPLPFLGDLDLATPSRQSTPSFLQQADLHMEQHTVAAREGERVCVLTEDRTGRFFQKSFDIPPLQPGGAALLQLAITGHGWEKTDAQCGEFCQMVYSLNFNGKAVQNVTQWRTDCGDNPTGSQDGTYTESRNGWCPGSVQGGVFLDVTKHLEADPSQARPNTMSIDIAVYDAATKKYTPYVDLDGFLKSDQAVLNTAANIFVYDEAAVEAVRGQPTAYSAAEKAIREGVSWPPALFDPKQDEAEPSSFAQTQETSFLRASAKAQRQGQIEFAVNNPGSWVLPRSSLSQVSDTISDSFRDGPVDSGRLNLEAGAPWYHFDSSQQTLTEDRVDPVVVPMFSDEFMNIDHRVAQMFTLPENIPEDYGHVALHFKLARPKRLDLDFWDRIGSLGFAFDGDLPGVTLHSGPAPATRDLRLRPAAYAASGGSKGSNGKM